MLLVRLCETWSFNKNAGAWRPETVTTPEVEGAIIDAIGEDPSNSYKKLYCSLKSVRNEFWKF